jgi:hypothetical protein
LRNIHANIFNLGKPITGCNSIAGYFLDDAGHQGCNGTKQAGKAGLDGLAGTIGYGRPFGHFFDNNGLI